jgi:hypothetical protein
VVLLAPTSWVTERSFLDLSSLPLGSPGQLSMVRIRYVKELRQERSVTLSIAALGIAVAYLFTVVVGATGVLLVLIWLFRDTSDVDRRTERETFSGLRGAGSFESGSTSSARVEPGRPEDKAA